MSDFTKDLPGIFKERLSEDVMSSSPITTGKHNTSYFVDTKSGQYVIRIAPPDGTVLLFYEKNMMAQEPELHRIIRKKTDTPVAEVVEFDSSRSIIDRDYIIMLRLEGNPLSQTPVTEAQYNRIMHEIGEYLAQVHSITAGSYGYIGAHRPMEPQKTWWNAFRVMWGKLLDDIVGVGMYSDDERETLVRLLDDNKGCFEDSQRMVEPSLLHMDIWSQNILVDGNLKVTGIVDWDRALWGDPEIEYAVLDYCGISQPGFWEGYGRTRDDSTEARIRHVFYHLYEHQKYIVIRIGRRNNPDAARQYKDETFQILRKRLSF